jgi:diguanylate cyclase (GGDEF)-like protein/PAS domain S-box-containing protein
MSPADDGTGMDAPARAAATPLTLPQLHEILETLSHGIMLIDDQGIVQHCNQLAMTLLGVNHDTPLQGASMAGTLPELAAFVEASHGKTLEGFLADTKGRDLHVAFHRLEGGRAVIHVEDQTGKLKRERRLALAEAEYRSLFENSVYGIYRDSLDGKPIRANPALARFNGYANEQQHIAAVYDRPGNWYVNPRRAEEFHRILKSEGRVTDLVSEVYRHRTGERCWVTENAWYVHDAVGVPMYIEGTIQDASERVSANAEIERLARFDSLTGAANRFLFLKMLAEWTERPDRPFALFCVDLDRFKEVNDTLGHAAGDFVLRTSIARLQDIGGPDCIVARLGGDEFALLKEISGSDNEAEAIASRIVARIAEPMISPTFNLQVGASVGVALCPLHAASPDDLLNSADLALYHVKSNGRNTWHVFDFSLKEVFNGRKSIERDLRQAIEAGTLELHYQPIVETGHCTTVRLEALMRWFDPDRGQVSPALFIPIAEESGLMPALGHWAIATAAEHARGLPETIRIAVNVSAIQLRSTKLVTQIEDVLASTGLDPSRLELEVTETAIMSSLTTAGQVINQLRQLGIHFALDDFGTGYSSLSYLQRFAFNTVKIDRSFVAGMREKPANLAVIRAVLSIGRDLGIDVVAEGVETEAQRDALVHEGCGLLQGYLFGIPRSYADTVSDLALRQLQRPGSRGLQRGRKLRKTG